MVNHSTALITQITMTAVHCGRIDQVNKESWKKLNNLRPPLFTLQNLCLGEYFSGDINPKTYDKILCMIDHIRDDLFKILKEDLPVVNDKDKDNDNDIINHPGHYETGKYECIDVMREALGDEAVKGFCICNAFKYIYRHRRKNGGEYIDKAIWYLNKWKELQEESDGEQR